MNVPIAIALIDLVVVIVLIVAARGGASRAAGRQPCPCSRRPASSQLMLAKLVAEMANPGTVVPICTALGFAYVLRITECDQHLIRLLLRPLQHVRWLLIPGGILAGYLVNTTIVSQTGTAAVLGPILIPLLACRRLPPATAGAILLLGSSMGGELFNPGAVEMRKLAELTGLSGPEVVARSTAQNLLACGTALLSFWALCSVAASASRLPATMVSGRERAGGRFGRFRDQSDQGHGSRVAAGAARSPTRAWGPFLRCGRWRVRPRSWPRCSSASSLAGLTSPRVGGQLATAFFEGRVCVHPRDLADRGGIDLRGGNQSQRPDRGDRPRLVGWPSAALVVSAIAPWGLAVVSGTGIAPAISIMEFFVPVAAAMHLIRSALARSRPWARTSAGP